jgi:methanogenic corrinoid protein MtbC1
VLAPVQRELGRLWQIGRLEPAMEHIATRIVQESLQVIERAAPRPPAGAPMVALVRLAADQHSLGQEFLALQLRVEGLRTRVVTLGDDERGGLGVERVVELQPAAIAFSLSPLSLAAAAARAITALRRALPGCAILAGGAALRDLPQLATQLGADGGGTDAAAAAARLTAVVVA